MDFLWTFISHLITDFYACPRSWLMKLMCFFEPCRYTQVTCESDTKTHHIDLGLLDFGATYTFILGGVKLFILVWLMFYCEQHGYICFTILWTIIQTGILEKDFPSYKKKKLESAHKHRAFFLFYFIFLSACMR